MHMIDWTKPIRTKGYDDGFVTGRVLCTDALEGFDGRVSLTPVVVLWADGSITRHPLNTNSNSSGVYNYTPTKTVYLNVWQCGPLRCWNTYENRNEANAAAQFEQGSKDRRAAHKYILIAHPAEVDDV
jgi:hypothetical protein